MSFCKGQIYFGNQLLSPCDRPGEVCVGLRGLRSRLSLVYTHKSFTVTPNLPHYVSSHSGIKGYEKFADLVISFDSD